MEQVQEEVSINSNNNNKLDQKSHIIKRKRTKRQRQRPQSPVPYLHNPNDKKVSPAAASSAEEDELDMVNCLIMLSQCQSRNSPKQAHYDHQQELAQIDQIHNHNNKFINRKFLETPSSGSGSGSNSGNSLGTGNGGYYVYECKTCYKMFPSFHALGGHRASHKKPNKSMVTNDEEDGDIRKVSSLSLQLSNNYNNDNNRGGNRNLFSPSSSSSNNMKSNRVHDCSICGAEFTSGQALGGHMRRHRAAAPVSAAAARSNRTLSLSPMEVGVEVPRKSRNNMLYLDLDLNLPAPEDDMIRESKLPFSPEQQKQQEKSCLVFSATPTLVDCHY